MYNIWVKAVSAKPFYWYADRIGQVFRVVNVDENKGNPMLIVQRIDPDISLVVGYMALGDCESVNPPKGDER